MTHLILHPRTAGQLGPISYGQNDSWLQEKRVSTLQNTRQNNNKKKKLASQLHKGIASYNHSF